MIRAGSMTRLFALSALTEGDIDILRSYRPERESSLKITLALGLTKGEKTDLVVEKATELGVQTLVPFISSYTVPKLNDRKIETRTERWQRIALSATKQCGRTLCSKNSHALRVPRARETALDRYAKASVSGSGKGN